jgi:hypothetical protein
MRGFIVMAAAAVSAAPALAADIGLQNASFEDQHVGSYCYFHNPAITACAAGVWSMPDIGNSGIISENDGAWPGKTAVDGDYFGFVQMTGYVQQTFTATATGNFTLNWFDAGRDFHGGYDGDQTYDVLINGVSIYSGGTTSGQAFTQRSSDVFHLSAGQSYTLTFKGHSASDNTSFIDAISAEAAVPEPASWAMMLGGFGLVGGALRRRRLLAATA